MRGKSAMDQHEKDAAEKAEVAEEYADYKEKTNEWQVRQDDASSELEEKQAVINEDYQIDKRELREEQDDRDERRKRDRRTRLGAYVLICTFGALGFWQVDKSNNQTERLSLELGRQICDSANANRKVLTDLISQGAPIPIPINSEASLKEVLETANGQNTVFRKNALKTLEPQPCDPALYAPVK